MSKKGFYQQRKKSAQSDRPMAKWEQVLLAIAMLGAIVFIFWLLSM